MSAEYLIRFDDICPTMNWGIWERIENILIRQKIAPILAIVPDNKDPSLMVHNARSEFWDVVRSWQARGWAIGIHGYQHTYVTDQAGLVGINSRSEFAGLGEQEQESKLENALAIFRREEIIPEVWIAPGHSFDSITLRLIKKLGIGVVSDGFYLSPNIDSLGITHVPQQLWKLRQMPFGLWTVCYHHNHWSASDVERFAFEVRRYTPRITSLRRVLRSYRMKAPSFYDTLFSQFFLGALHIRRSIWNFCGRSSTTIKADLQS